jgi:glycosyltransferase involved in cell wall biosynthesis
VSALEGRVPRVLITAQSSAMAGVERRLLQEVAVLRGLGATVLAAPARFPRSEQFRTALVQAGAELMDWQPYKFIERQQTGFPFPQWCSWASRAVRRARLDLAHVAMPWTTVGLSRVWALQRAKVPVVLGLHCTYDRGRWPAQLLPYLQQALRGVVGMYAVSETVRLSFLDNFGRWVEPDDIEVIQNGVDTKRFHCLATPSTGWRHRLGIPADGELVVFCGRLDPFKNPEFALDVVEHALASRPALHLAVAGEGPLADRLRERVAASSRLVSRVHMLGFVDSVEALLQEADLYLSTSSSSEGFPLAPSEALACGLPILVPGHAVFREAFGTCPVARMVPGLVAADWATAVTQVLDMPVAWRRQQAREFAEAWLTLERMQHRLASFYRRWL